MYVRPDDCVHWWTEVRWGVNLFGTLAAAFVPMMLAAWWGGKTEKPPEN